MHTLHSIARRVGIIDLRHNGAAPIMLAISIFALYSNVFVLVIVPLIWMGYRIGKEMGRQEAHDELAHATPTSLPDHADR